MLHDLLFWRKHLYDFSGVKKIMDNNNNNDDKEKINEEIEELLNNINNFPSEKKAIYNFFSNRFKKIRTKLIFVIMQTRSFFSTISFKQLLLFSFALIFLSLFFRRINPFIMQWVFFLGSIIFVISFAGLALFNSRKGNEKYWRGEIIKYENTSLFNKIKKIFKKD
ncbi:MAG: hypothetical protein DK305_000818 [Chloroflexi bacterium]|jgi:hypothetical protein|nr:MAG: hypothetical protein DK305_000818 [Chloroflexota bacterium]|tara:strand:- start:306 stop:803 length:498 start_codon:yes stop_codon:yes gene_type:complete